MPAPPRPLPVVFFATSPGAEPVRAWLKTLPAAERKLIGEDIKTVQFRWPLGMPLVRNLGSSLWEVRNASSDSDCPNLILRPQPGNHPSPWLHQENTENPK